MIEYPNPANSIKKAKIHPHDISLPGICHRLIVAVTNEVTTIIVNLFFKNSIIGFMMI